MSLCINVLVNCIIVDNVSTGMCHLQWYTIRGSMVQWVALLTRNVSVVDSSPRDSKAAAVSLSKKLYPYC